MKANGQEKAPEFRGGLTTETVYRRVLVELETSQTKNKHVRDSINEFQEMQSYVAEMVPSIPERDRTRNNPTFYRMVTREFDDRIVKSTVVNRAIQRVLKAFKAWKSLGKPGDRPSFGEGSYIALSNKDFSLVENEKGYGLKGRFIPYNPVWFHVNPSGYQKDYLEKIFDGAAEPGTCELYLKPDGTLKAQLVVKWDVEVYEPENITTSVGVDIGETTLYAAAVVDTEGVNSATVETGREFRHHRNRLKEKLSRLKQKGDLRAVKECEGERERYIEQVLDTASREIVEVSLDNAPSMIVLEDLKGYREDSQNPIHDWPFAKLQKKIIYKATEKGIPVLTVNARDTSISCRKCPGVDVEYRHGTDFKCRRCGYEVHADVNAAINIAKRGLN